jgi:hypothetical protein
MERLATPSPCGAQPYCGKPTKSRCRACQAALCVQCIRMGKQCMKAAAETGRDCRVRGHCLTVDAERRTADASHATSLTGREAERRSSVYCFNGNATASAPRATIDFDADDDAGAPIGTATLHSRRSRTCSVPVAKERGRLQVAERGRSASPSGRASARNHGRQRAELLARLMTMDRDDVAVLPAPAVSLASVPTKRPGGGSPSERASIGDPSNLSSARRPAAADDRIGYDQHHHPRVFASPLEAAALPPSIASDSCRHHHHHHDGSSESSASVLPCFDARINGQASLNTWHEEEPRQHDVVAAASRTDSVPLLSQVSPVVVVAAEAAGVSHLTGLPRHQLECHGDMTAELMEVNPNWSLSAGAAALSSYDGIHLGALATPSPFGPTAPSSRANVPEEPCASRVST